jgi:hypothetical protein
MYMESLASGIAAPANADLALGETVEADADTGKLEGDGSAPSSPEAGAPAPSKRDAVQERIDKLTREKYDALRERDRNAYELERLREQAQKQAPTDQVAPDEFPTLEQFGYDEGKFNAAVAAHFSKLATEQARVAAQEQLKAERENQQREQAQKTWTQKEADFRKLKPDYAEKVFKEPRDGGPAITESMYNIIQDSDQGPAVAYYLAENVEKSAAIAALSPLAQAREIGRIEAKLEAAKAPPKPLVSQAPPPPSKLDTAGEATRAISSTDPDSYKLSDDEWVKAETARLKRKQKRAS